MTPTREQLELAAKAAGIEGWWTGSDYCYRYIGNPNVPIPWQPWEYKPDSFDLMVAIGGGHIAYFQGKIHFYTEDEMACVALADHNNDKGLATMWAVFLCAVEIGRAM